MGTIKVYSPEYGLDGMCCLAARESTGYAEGYTIKNNQTAVDILNVTFTPSVKINQYIYMIACDRDMKVLGLFIVASGEPKHTRYSLRNIILSALLCKAHNIIIARNDPEGEWKFTKDELADYHKLKDTVRSVDIKVTDYLILSENEYLSVEEQKRQSK